MSLPAAWRASWDKVEIMAGMIKHEDIERVRQRADLYEVVSDSVALKRSGSGEFMGLCPFHDEKTPSFAVRPGLGLWHCFGCGLGGDVFAYVERHDGVGFADAVEILADKFGVTLHYEKSQGGQRRKGSSRTRLLEVNEAAQNFFVHCLGTKEALPARQLLGGRTFTAQDAAHFGCGYAPKGWDNLVGYLSDKGFTQKEMIDAGVARQGRNGSAYDYFRGRLTWPIRDTAGRTLGFGARKLYDDDTIAAKYINTPDTQLYHKERVLYGLDLARKHILHDHEIVVVEGYTDVMACHLAGVRTAVATCGTAFGEQHAKIARRLIGDMQLGAQESQVSSESGKKFDNPHIIFTFDGDAAGRKAARRAFRLNNEFLTQTFVTVIPGNLDPCDLRIHGESVPTRDLPQNLRRKKAKELGIAENGQMPATMRLEGDEAVRHEIHDMARPLYDYMLDYTIGQFDLHLLPQKAQAMEEAATLLAQISAKSDTLAQLYTRQVSGRLGLDPQQSSRFVEQVARQRRALGLHAFRGSTLATRQARAQQQIEGGMGLGDRVLQAGPGTPLDVIQKRYLDLLVEQDDYRRDYERLRLRWVQDPVYSSEQQLSAAVVQMPQAFDPKQWAQLSSGSFNVPMFRALYTAVQAVGRLPRAGEQIANWLQELQQAGGPQLDSVITALAVTPLPIYTQDGRLPPSRRPAGESNSAVNSGQFGQPGQASGRSGQNAGQNPNPQAQERELLERRRQETFAEPTEEEKAFVSAHLVELIDAGQRQSLADLRTRFARTRDPQEKSDLMRQILVIQLSQKTQRQRLFDRSFDRDIQAMRADARRESWNEPASEVDSGRVGAAPGTQDVPNIGQAMPGSLRDVPNALPDDPADPSEDDPAF